MDSSPIGKASKAMKLNQEQNDSDPKISFNSEAAHFFPHFKTGSNNYKLMYAPYNIFMFVKFFYAIYERVVMAKSLIKEKIM